MKKQTNDLENELVESGNWTRIDEIVKEIRQLYKRERNARAHRTNLLLGQKFIELRKLVTGTDEDFNPKSAEGRRWGRFVKAYLKGCGVSRATTYRCAGAWKVASAMVPEPVLTQLAQREEMIGVAVSGEKPLGKFTLAIEAAAKDEPNFDEQENVEAFIENVLAHPEAPKKSDALHSLYVRVIKGLVAIAKGRQTTAAYDGEKREVTAEMLREPLYTLVSTIQRGIEMNGTHEYESANDLPEGYGDWQSVILNQTEPTEVGDTEVAEETRKPKTKRKAKSRAKSTESADDLTETTPQGYFGKLNRKPKGATQESQPWEIFQSVQGAKAKFCCREANEHDAKERIWKLDSIAEEEKQNTSTTTNNDAVGAAAM
jgi:hypothetical protein